VLHSFAWIVSEYLVKLPNLPNMETFSDQINKSIEDYIKQLKPELIAGYAKRIHMKSEVEKVLKEKQSNLQIQLFGSSAILLFEPTSDVDVAVFPSTYNGSTNDALSKEQQLKVLKEISSSLPFKNVKLQEEPAVPVIKCEDDLIAPSETTPFSLDISVNPEGVLKRDILFTLLAEYPFLYPLFYFVCKWYGYSGCEMFIIFILYRGRDSGIILHSRDSLLSTFHLICLMISYCSEKKLIDMQKILSNYHKRSYVEEVGFWERFLTSIDYSQQDLYSLILGFFTKYATASSIVVAEPLGKRHTIDTAKVATLRNIFTRSMHFLALNNDISNMLKICRERKGSSEVIMSVRLSTLLRYGYSERHFLEHVSKTSGATLSILKYGTAAFQLKISGNNGVIQKAIKDINDIQV
jgi:predicted nucleotidyltransferase